MGRTTGGFAAFAAFNSFFCAFRRFSSFVAILETARTPDQAQFETCVKQVATTYTHGCVANVGWRNSLSMTPYGLRVWL